MTPVQYDIVHTTVYRYKQPVTFGEHRVMFRPRDSHDLRVLATDLQVSPQALVRMIQDPHSNSVALVQPLEPATELRIVCRFTIEHAHTNNLELPLSPSAAIFPFAYGLADRFDLEQYLRPHHDDPGGTLTAWARQFMRTDGLTGTRDLLVAMNQHIRNNFRYAARDDEGTQTPQQTLERGAGSCRDFALLMMEAARRLGIATRFVSGYLYDPACDVVQAPASADSASPSTTPEPDAAEALALALPRPDVAPAMMSTGATASSPAATSASSDTPPSAFTSADSMQAPPTQGAGYTHAWLQAYLPGAGWVPFDPTNNLVGGNTLIRVGVARDPSQAAPVSGVWFGEPDDYLGLDVSVTVRRR